MADKVIDTGGSRFLDDVGLKRSVVELIRTIRIYEQMGGIADGVNKNFTSSKCFYSDSVILYLNGARQTLTQFAVYNDRTIQFVVAPTAGYSVWIDYISTE